MDTGKQTHRQINKLVVSKIALDMAICECINYE